MFESSHPDSLAIAPPRGEGELRHPQLAFQSNFWKASSSGQAPMVSSILFPVMYNTYIIESLASGRWYYGSTADLSERLKYHNSGWNRSTNGRGPWKYIFVREFDNMDQAREFEFHLKKLKRKAYILSKYSEYFLNEA